MSICMKSIKCQKISLMKKKVCFIMDKAVGRSENPGVTVVISPPLVEVGLTDQPKSGCAALPGTTPLIEKGI